MFIPIFIAAIGYLQTKNKFCVAYGSSGRQNASDGSSAAQVVEDSDAIAADKKKSRDMNLRALAISAALTILILFIPNF